MTLRTRYFVIASLLVLVVGLGTGLVAYYVGLPDVPFARHAGPDELQYVPRDAAVVAYANVHDVMTSDLRQRIRQAAPGQNGQREFEDQTGINIETDIDRVVACLDPSLTGGDSNHLGLVLARGRFNEVKIEGLLREHGARVEEYKGKRLLAGETPVRDRDRDAGKTGNTFALAFVEPGLVAIGSEPLVRSAIDLQGGGQNVTTNDGMMKMVRSLDGANAWAVGRFDALRASTRLPANVESQIPPITWFSVAGHIDGGVRGTVRAETRDEESAKNLRDVVRGFLALVKMQAGARPELQTLTQSLELGGTGTTVSLSFDVPVQALDLLGPGRQRDRAVPRQ